MGLVSALQLPRPIGRPAALGRGDRRAPCCVRQASVSQRPAPSLVHLLHPPFIPQRLEEPVGSCLHGARRRGRPRRQHAEQRSAALGPNNGRDGPDAAVPGPEGKRHQPSRRSFYLMLEDDLSQRQQRRRPVPSLSFAGGRDEPASCHDAIFHPRPLWTRRPHGHSPVRAPPRRCTRCVCTGASGWSARGSIAPPPPEDSDGASIPSFVLKEMASLLGRWMAAVSWMWACCSGATLQDAVRVHELSAAEGLRPRACGRSRLDK